MKKNVYATNQVGIVKAPNPVKDDPKSMKQVGEDLRSKAGK